MIPETLPESLRERIYIRPHPELEAPCWIVEGRASRNGYARLWWRGREPVAHRVAWEVLCGPIPDGLILDHKCRQRRCCNPAHLEPVTVRENTTRGEAVLFRPLSAA